MTQEFESGAEERVELLQQMDELKRNEIVLKQERDNAARKLTKQVTIIPFFSMYNLCKYFYSHVFIYVCVLQLSRQVSQILDKLLSSASSSLNPASCLSSFSFTYPLLDVADLSFTNRSSAVRPTLQTLAPFQSSIYTGWPTQLNPALRTLFVRVCMCFCVSNHCSA